MWEFNIVATMDREGRFGHLMKELSLYGVFHRTEFFGVVLGRVEDAGAFLEKVRQKREKQLVAFQDLGRVLPVDRVFTFQPENFLDRVREAVRPYIPRLGGKRYYVRLERRGFKGVIVSPEAEQALDRFIEEELEKEGKSARVDFENPDAVVVVETFGDRCGVGLLTREMMERYTFVRVG
jgi:tRNA(Ser,Leu) C12 N-acetylase TAN1